VSDILAAEQQLRQQLLGNVEVRLEEHKTYMEADLQAARVHTNVSLLQHQVVIASQAEQISTLQRQTSDLLATSLSLQQVLHEADKQVAGLSLIQDQLKNEIITVTQAASKWTSEQLPALSSDAALLKYDVQTLQRQQDFLLSEQHDLSEKQWELIKITNLSTLSLSDRLQEEISHRKEKDTELSAQFQSQLDIHNAGFAKQFDKLAEDAKNEHQELSTLERKVGVLSEKAISFADSISSLQKQALQCQDLEAEVGDLKGDVKVLQQQFLTQSAAHDKELLELRGANNKAMDMIAQLQQQLERQSAMMLAMQQEQITFKASFAERQQVEQVKDRLMDMQQGTMLQVTNILQLIQQQQSSNKQ
jgi:hypothetical protein